MKLKVLFFIIIIILISGLNNYRELNDLAIVSSIGIDKAEDGSFTITAQIMNSKKETSGTKSDSASSKITIYKAKNNNIQQGLRNMVNESPKRLYINHMEMLIVSEEVLREGISPIIDFFLRDVEANKEFRMLVAKKGSKAEDILKILTPIETNPTNNLRDSLLATLKYKGTTVDSVLEEVTSTLLSEGKDVVMASVEIKGDPKKGQSEENLKNSEPETSSEISQIAYFKDGKLQGYLEEEDNLYFTILADKLHNGIITEKIQDEEVVMEIIELNTSLKPKIKNGKLTIDINVKSNMIISEKSENFRVDTTKDIDLLEQELEKIVTKKLETCMNDMRTKYQADILGIGNMCYKYQNKEYMKIKDQFYTEYLNKAQINVKVNIDIENEGGVVKKW